MNEARGSVLVLSAKNYPSSFKMFIEVCSSVNTEPSAKKYFLTKQILSHKQDNPPTWELLHPFLNN